MADASALQRVAFSPGEFAELFGKSQTWGYRQIYAGKVKAITEHGRFLIPAAEVEKILGTAGIYDGLKPKAAKTKAQMQSLAKPQLQSAWQTFLAARRQTASQQKASSASKAKVKWPSAAFGREAALARLTQRQRKKLLPAIIKPRPA